MKTCTRCNVEKENICFGINRATNDGYSYYCKECTSILGKERREATPVYAEQAREEAPQSTDDVDLLDATVYFINKRIERLNFKINYHINKLNKVTIIKELYEN